MNILDFSVPEEDRAAFAKIMAYLAQIDQEVTLEEKQAIDDMIYAWRLDENSIFEIYEILEKGASIESLLGQLKNKKSKYLLIQELITLSNIDGNYGKNEKAAIDKIASELHVSNKRVKELEQWVSDGMKWRKRGIKLIQPEGE